VGGGGFSFEKQKFASPQGTGQSLSNKKNLKIENIIFKYLYLKMTKIK